MSRLDFSGAAESISLMKIHYPPTKMIEHFDEYYGERLSDPYRWLEDDEATAVKQWVKNQNEVTFDYLDAIPYREPIRERLEKLWDYEKFSAPFNRGGYTYYYKNDGLQNQAVLYRQQDGLPPEVFLDPNTFSEDGTTSLSGISFTKDGTLAAYMISKGGSDWREVVILDAERNKPMEGGLSDVKFSGLAWKNREGFYYSSYDKPKEGSALSGKTQHHKLYYHRLGTPQSEDELIFGGSQKPRRYVFGQVTEDQRWLIISAAESTTGNELYIKDLSASGAPIIPVVEGFGHNHLVVHSSGDLLYVFTQFQAPNGRLVKVDPANPQPENWVDLIPEADRPLTVRTGGGYLFAEYLKDAIALIKQYDLDGHLVREVELPGNGTVAQFGGRWEESTLYYTYTSYTTPATIYRYDVETGASQPYKYSGVSFNPTEYVTKQVFYESKDGTRVPMMITHKKGLVKDGTNPALLYGYGGFSVNLTPAFSVSNIIWLDNGGIYAVPNLRGGGEYGEEWHLAGTKLNKQNVFDDFIAAAEYLIDEGYTNSSKLAIAGASNGGLLVGAVMTQRPDLMQVALPAVGVLDMLRYHQFTAGAGWAYDYGTVDESREMYAYLKGYSPYHNLEKRACYPATMITTGDHDDRVVPAHSFKYAARLQWMQGCDRPVLIRINTNAGHGLGKPTSLLIREQADKWAFTFFNLGVEFH